MSHTLPPWHFDSGCIWGGPNGTEMVCELGYFPSRAADYSGNAGIIVAAPELLEMLAAILREAEPRMHKRAPTPDERGDCIYCKAHAAIAKARGEA